MDVTVIRSSNENRSLAMAAARLSAVPILLAGPVIAAQKEITLSEVLPIADDDRPGIGNIACKKCKGSGVIPAGLFSKRLKRCKCVTNL